MKKNLLHPEFERLLNLALQNQSFPTDLLLIVINGFFKPLENPNMPKTIPYVIGPGDIGHSESTHYSFIHAYRDNSIVQLTHSEYLNEVKWRPDRREIIDEYIQIEEFSIQIEMLIYLKFWEADLIIKNLYQFVTILNGNPYEWHFKISESNRDKEGHGTRQEIIRKDIRDKVKDISPILYQTIKDSYKTQIRNSIAHSNYSFQNRNIHPNNFIENDVASQLKYLSFDDWIDMFHNTLLLHNEYIWLKNSINNHYANLAKAGQDLTLRITEPSKHQFELPIKYREEWDDWRWNIK